MQQNPSRLTLTPLLISLALFIVLAIFIKSQLATIDPVPASAPENVFSGERAFNMLAHLTKEQVPHPVDSAANRIVEQRLIALLRGMGYQEEIQDTRVCRDSKRGFARCTRVRNIIVNIEGTNQGKTPGKGILLAAHYDSVPAGPGGSDAGAAVGTLLETARLLSLSAKPLNSIVLLFNEGEEFGLMGAKAFMEQHPLAKNLQLAINVEARGSSGQSVMFETGEDSGWLVKHYANTTPAPLSSSLFYEVYKYLPNDTDLTIFKAHGLQGLNFAHAERLPHYHTPLDNLANLDRGSLQHHGDNVWGVLNSIKDTDLTQATKGNLVYSDVMGLFVIQWDEATSLWLSLLLLLGLALVIIAFSKQQQLHIRQQLKGLLAFVVILNLCAIAALLVQLLTRTISGNPVPWHINSLPMQLAMWLGVLLPGLLCAKWFAKKASPVNMTIAVTIAWVVLSLTTSLLMPGISFLFIIPASAAVSGLLFIAWLSSANFPGQSKNTVQTIVLILMAGITAITFLPVAYVLEIMVSYHMPIAIGIVLGFLVSALLPLLAIKTTSAGAFRQLIYAITLMMLIAIGWTSWQPAYSQWMPQKLNINYVQNEKGEAFILAGHNKNKVPPALATALRGELRSTAIFPWAKRRYHTVATQSQQLNPPKLKIMQNSVTQNAKKVTVMLSADQKDLSDVKIYIPADGALISIESHFETGGETKNEVFDYLGEKSIRNGFYEYHCRGLSCAQTKLTLNFSTIKPVKILVASVLAGLPEAHHELINKRGDIAVPSQSGDQSVIIAEFEL